MIESKEEFNDLLSRLKAKDKENKLGKSLQTKLRAFLEVEELINLRIGGVVKSLPTKKDIIFDDSLMAEIETTDNNLKVLRAVNGFGQAINIEKVQINDK